MASRRAERLIAPVSRPHAIPGPALALLARGEHGRIHEEMGAHLTRDGAGDGVRFAVWAPAARDVAVVGDFNG